MRGRLLLAITFVATAAHAVPPGGEADPPQTKPVDSNPPPPVAVNEGGGPGETCTRRHDCAGELKCIRGTCTSRDSLPLPSPSPSPEPNPESTEHDDWLAFDLGGAHGFIGMSWGGGFAMTMSTLNGGLGTTMPSTTLTSTFLYALRAGVLLNRVEVGFEMAPMTYLPPVSIQCVSNFQFGTQCASTGGPVFEAAGTVGTWIPLVQRKEVGIYWPMRVGIGFIATTTARAYVQAIGDLIGVNVRVGHLYFGMRLPGFRYAFTPDDSRTGPGSHILSWIFGGDVGYVF